MRTILIPFIFLLTSNSFSQSRTEKDMVLIPAGEFIMGSNAAPGADFGPAHKVKVSAFYMDTHEVTNQQYFAFCDATGHKLPEFWGTDIFRSGPDYPDHPVVGINWRDAMSYAMWAGKRLPTEAEWEYAARGGLEGMDFPNGAEWTKERAVNEGPGWENLIEPTGSYEPNGYGLYDIGGNVWEWVADRYSEGYYGESEYENPRGPATGTTRVIRGGSWHSGAMCKKVFYRKGLIVSWCDFAVGFRCVKDMEETQ